MLLARHHNRLVAMLIVRDEWPDVVTFSEAFTYVIIFCETPRHRKSGLAIQYITCGSIYRIDMEYINNLIQKQPSSKKLCSPQEGHCEKRSEIQGGGQEMAVIVS